MLLGYFCESMDALVEVSGPGKNSFHASSAQLTDSVAFRQVAKKQYSKEECCLSEPDLDLGSLLVPSPRFPISHSLRNSVLLCS